MFRVSGSQGLCLGFQGLVLRASGPVFRVSGPQGLCLGFQGLCLGFQGPAFRVSRPQVLTFWVSGFQGLFQPVVRVSGPQGLCLEFQGPAFRVSRPQGPRGLCLGFRAQRLGFQGLKACVWFQGLNAVFFQVFQGFSRFFNVF